VKATEIVEELERLIYEFGDGDSQIPDPIEAWWYDVTRIERDPASNKFRFVADH
jgi:hypothetical protein